GRAARDDRQRGTVGTRSEVVDALCDLDEAAHGLRLGRGRRNLETLDFSRLAIENANARARGVNDTLPVRRGESGEVRRFVRVAAQIASVRQHGINVPDSFMVRKKGDAVSKPHGPAKISG